MVRILLPVAAALAACTPSPQESAMTSPGTNKGSGEAGASTEQPKGGTSVPAAPNAGAPGAPVQAAQGPMPEPVSATENPLPARSVEAPEEVHGRRILSAAFVRVGPDGVLTVELRSGRALVLRGVTMRPKDYCGVQVLGDRAGKSFCGTYGEVAAARPGGASAREAPDLAAPNPLEIPKGVKQPQ